MKKEDAKWWRTNCEFSVFWCAKLYRENNQGVREVLEKHENEQKKIGGVGEELNKEIKIYDGLLS